MPEGKKFVVRDLLESGLGPDDVTGIVGPGWLENHGLSPGFTTEDHQRSLYRLTNLGATYPSGTTIVVSSGGQAQSETGCYAFLQGYLIEEDYFDTPLQDPSDEQSDWGCGDPVSYEGHDYQTVKAGGRCWFAETLKYLPEVHEWSNQSSNEPRFYLRDYSGTSVEEARNESGFDTVGVYYNWTATAMNLCPTGWSVPLLDDWLRLLPVIGGSLEPNLYGTGSYMIDEDDWPQPDLIPHGKPYDFWQLKLKPNGRFIGDSSGEFWENVGIGFYQNIPNGMLAIGAWDLNLDVFGAYGYSNTIRCIKDSE